MELGGAPLRLGRLADHLLPESSIASARSASASSAQPDNGTPASPELSATQLREFVETGVCKLEPAMPDGYHQRLSDKMRGLVDAEAMSFSSRGGPTATASNQADLIRDSVQDDVTTVLRSAEVHSALTAILGPDYLVEPGMATHMTSSVDQTWHKDGTNLGWRDQRPEKVIIMYYPAGADAANGVTAVVPSSQYFSCDRGDNFVHSEDRLQRLFVPPLTNAEMSQRLVTHYDFRAGGVTDPDERDQILADDLALLGGGDQVEERFLFCKPGTVSIVHFDLVSLQAIPTTTRFPGRFLTDCLCLQFHRGARASDPDPWRPMFKISASRVSAPTAASVANSLALSPQAFHSPCAACVWDYLAHSSTTTAALSSASDAQKWWDTLQNSVSEVARVEAAVSLGRSGGFALLVQALNSERESLRRAATWGLAAGGGAVASTVIELLSKCTYQSHHKVDFQG